MSSMNGMGGYGQMAGPNGQVGNKIPSGYKMGQMQNYTPEMMQLFQSLFSHLGPDSFLSKLAGGDQSLFEEIEAPAHKQFQGLQGQIASRFSGMGMGGRKGSGFQNAMSQAGSDFAQQLQSNRQGLQRQALMDLMGMSNNLLQQKPYENFLVKKQQKPSWLAGAAPLAGAGIGAMLGGPAGMAIGGSLGSSFGAGLNGQQTPETDWSGISKFSTSW